MAATAAGGWAREATMSSASTRPRAVPSSILSTLSGRIGSTIREHASSTDSSVEPSGAKQPCRVARDNASIDCDAMKASHLQFRPCLNADLPSNFDPSLYSTIYNRRSYNTRPHHSQERRAGRANAECEPFEGQTRVVDKKE